MTRTQICACAYTTQMWACAYACVYAAMCIRARVFVRGLRVHAPIGTEEIRTADLSEKCIGIGGLEREHAGQHALHDHMFANP